MIGIFIYFQHFQ